MFLMGDEVRRTQYGNNNAYCQDNETSWFDWSLLREHADLYRFVKLLIARRSLRDIEDEHEQLTLTQLISRGIRGWHGVKLNQPDWSSHSHSVALSVELPKEDLLAHFIFNAFWEPLDFELPPIGTAQWKRWIDTSLESPEDLVDWRYEPTVSQHTYRAGPRSVVVLRASHRSVPKIT
jgi:glycogen operon protein